MAGLPTPPDMEEDEAEAFVGFEEGDIIDGEVIDDLDEGDMQMAPNEDDDDDMGEGPSRAPGEEVVDASAFCLRQHTGEVVAVAAHPSAPLTVASGGCDDKACLWQADTGQVADLAGHTDTVSHVAFSATGTILATAGVDGAAHAFCLPAAGAVVLWRTVDGAKERTLEGPGDEIQWLAWHPRGDVILAGSVDFTAWLWNAATGACMQVLTGHSGPVTCGGFTPDGKSVYTGSVDGSLKLWNPKTGECTTTVQGHPFHEQGVVCAAVSSDGTVALSGGEDGSLCLTSLHTGKVVGALAGHTESVEAVALPRQMPGAALSCSLDGRLIVWDVATQGVRLECKHPEQVVNFAVHPAQPVVATGCLDGIVRLWDMRTGQELRSWTGHSSGVQAVAFACDGSWVISASDDNTVRVFRVAADGA